MRIELNPKPTSRTEPFSYIVIHPAFVKGKGFGFYLTAEWSSGDFTAHALMQPEQEFVLALASERNSKKKLDLLTEGLEKAIQERNKGERIYETWTTIQAFADKHGLEIKN